MVRYGCLADKPGGGTISAERFCLEAMQALRNCLASPKSFSHRATPATRNARKPLGPGRNSHLYISEGLQHLQIPVNRNVHFSQLNQFVTPLARGEELSSTFADNAEQPAQSVKAVTKVSQVSLSPRGGVRLVAHDRMHQRTRLATCRSWGVAV